MDNHLLLLLIFLVAATVVVPFAIKKQLFSLSSQEKEKTAKTQELLSPLLALFLYVLIYLFVPLAVKKAILYFDMHGYTSFSKLEVRSLSLIAPLPLAAFVLYLFTRFHSSYTRHAIWGVSTLKDATRYLLKGIGFACISYPVIMGIVQLIHVFAIHVLNMSPIDQVALSILKSLKPLPWLFWMYAVAVITFVPFVEELLFRGYIQGYLSSIFGTRWAILLASSIFVFFHYAPCQGMANIELLIGLFIFSYLIGIVYVKQKTVYAAMGMHAGFNFLSVVLLLTTYESTS